MGHVRVGIVCAIYEAQKRADIQSMGKVYSFDCDAIMVGSFEDIFEGIQVAFELQNNKAVKVMLNLDQEKPEYLEYLKITKDVHACVSDYFQPFEEFLQSHPYTPSDIPQTDFVQLKRFIITAYNSIRHIDGSIIDKDILASKNELIKIIKHHSDFRSKSNQDMDVAYARVFLKQQENYGALMRRISRTQRELKEAHAQQKPLENNIKKRERDLGNHNNPRGHSFLVLQKNLKNMHRRYTELKRFINKQKKLLSGLVRVKDILSKRYFEVFQGVYESTAKDIDTRLTHMLNAKILQIDSMLWERAKKSSLVRDFFINSGIIGTYSTKTFLKYHLRHIDKKKANEEVKKLFVFLKYLENVGAKNIFMIKKDPNAIKHHRKILEDFNQGSHIYIVHDLEEILQISIKSSHANVALIDIEALGKNAFISIENFLKEMKKAHKSITLCLFVHTMASTALAQKLGITHFIKTPCRDDVFIDKMRELL